MADDSKSMIVSSKAIRDFIQSFDSPEEALMTLKNKAADLAKDVDALVHSMCNLFEQDALAYSLADVYIKVEMTAFGTDFIKAQIGNPDLLKRVVADIVKAKEEVNGI